MGQFSHIQEWMRPLNKHKIYLEIYKNANRGDEGYVFNICIMTGADRVVRTLVTRHEYEKFIDIGESIKSIIKKEITEQMKKCLNEIKVQEAALDRMANVMNYLDRGVMEEECQ